MVLGFVCGSNFRPYDDTPVATATHTINHMELLAQKREQFGRAVKTLRKQGLIPAELYGHGVENLHLSVPLKDFKKAFKAVGESAVVTVVVGEEKKPVLIHDVSYHPVTDEILSVDFYQIRLDEKIKVKVPLRFIGESPAVKNLGGLLVKAVSEIEIEALPMDIPAAIDVPLQKIAAIGQSIHVRELAVPPSVKVLVELETVVATVKEKMTEEEEQKLAAEGAKVEEVKVEAEEKKAERAAVKQAEAPAGEEKPAATPAKPTPKAGGK